MTRDEALALLHEHTKGESLRKHALAVEAAMRHFARERGGDEETWAVVGLLHDFAGEQGGYFSHEICMTGGAPVLPRYLMDPASGSFNQRPCCYDFAEVRLSGEADIVL